MAKTGKAKIYTAIDLDKNYVEDPAIVKVAKLVLILADKDTDIETKRLCVKALERFEYITPEEATQLLFYRTELERFKSHYQNTKFDRIS